MCYIEVTADGSVSQGVDDAAYQRALTGQSRLFAVWPGSYRSDLFAIDDLDQFARGMGWVHDEASTGLAEHEHQVRWRLSESERNPTASYISVRVWLDCGCMLRDLNEFAKHMRSQQGWDIAMTGGWGSSSDRDGTSYSMRVRRKSLSQPR